MVMCEIINRNGLETIDGREYIKRCPSCSNSEVEEEWDEYEGQAILLKGVCPRCKSTIIINREGI